MRTTQLFRSVWALGPDIYFGSISCSVQKTEAAENCVYCILPVNSRKGRSCILWFEQWYALFFAGSVVVGDRQGDQAGGLSGLLVLSGLRLGPLLGRRCSVVVQLLLLQQATQAARLLCLSCAQVGHCWQPRISCRKHSAWNIHVLGLSSSKEKICKSHPLSSFFFALAPPSSSKFQSESFRPRSTKVYCEFIERDAWNSVI